MACGAVAAGHEQTAAAARWVLRQGGNAFDAVIAAHFAACVAEPVLSSLGGGGFLCARQAGMLPRIYDFFSHTPHSKKSGDAIEFIPVEVDFGTAQQVFHIGMGATAIPGTVAGLWSVHRELATLPLSMLVQPAQDLARNGVVINDFQAYIFRILAPILSFNKASQSLFTDAHGGILQAGMTFRNPDFADTLDYLVTEGSRGFYQGDLASLISQLSTRHGGHIQMEDLEQYRTLTRNPLTVNYQNHQIYLNPPPSSGGVLIACALHLLQHAGIGTTEFGSLTHLRRLTEIMALTQRIRNDFLHAEHALENLLSPELLQAYRRILDSGLSMTRGTTHISVVDNAGNSASLTTSNGEGNGYIIPGTGILLNNMLGEEDLNPLGFHRWREDTRLTSMMCPSLITGSNGTEFVIGSGGSNRIRSAILQVISGLLDFQFPLPKAVANPRIHFENGTLHLETGFNDVVKKTLQHHYHVNSWPELNLYFGGAHCVGLKQQQMTAVGDIRRGGVGYVVP